MVFAQNWLTLRNRLESDPEIQLFTFMKPPLPDRLAQALLIELASGSYHEGKRFLSRRTIMKQWKVSSLTATRALEKLTKSGLLKITDRSGNTLEKGFRKKTMILLQENQTLPLPAKGSWEFKARAIISGEKPLRSIAVVLLHEDYSSVRADTDYYPADKIGVCLKAFSPLAFTETIRSIFRSTSDLNISVDFYISNGSEVSTDEVLNNIVINQNQGVIILKRLRNLSVSSIAQPLIKLGIPVVSAFDHCENLKMISVNFNNVAIGYTAVKELAKMGHQRIGVLYPSGPEEPNYFRDRLLGAQLLEGKDYNSKIQIVPIEIDGESGLNGQYLLNLFNLKDENRITAVFSTSVEMISLIFSKLKELRISIPKHLSVICCSTSPKVEQIRSPLDLMKIDFAKIGTETVDSIRALYFGDFKEKISFVNSDYVPYGSVKPPFIS